MRLALASVGWLTEAALGLAVYKIGVKLAHLGRQRGSEFHARLSLVLQLLKIPSTRNSLIKQQCWRLEDADEDPQLQGQRVYYQPSLPDTAGGEEAEEH